MRQHKASLLVALTCVLCARYPIAAQVQRTWSLVETNVIGALDDPNYTLTRIEPITGNTYGHIFVLQHEEGVVKEYDSRGRFVRRIGRRGSGPGEFSFAAQLWWLKDHLLVLDQGSSRISRFDGEGRFAGAIPLQGGGLPYLLQPIQVMADGSLVGHKQVMASDLPSKRATIPVIVSRGTSVDTLFWLNLDGRISTLTANNGRGVFIRRNPFADHDLVVAQPEHARVIVMTRRRAQPESPVLLWLGLTGDTLRERKLALTPRIIPKAIRDSVIDSFARAAVVTNMVANIDRGRVFASEQLRLPRTFPPASDMIAATDGHLWIRTSPAGSEVTWLVLDGEGRAVATVDVPGNLRVHFITGTTLWGVRHDEFELPYVVSYRIVRTRL